MHVFLTATLAVFAAFLLTGCGIHDPSARRCGTEVPDPEDKEVSLVGCVEHADLQPAAYVRVTACRDDKACRSDNASADTQFTQFTDENGRFTFGKELDSGTYNLFFEDSVAAVDKRTVHLTLPSVRLVPPTLLALLVRDNETDKSIAGAICQLTGTPYKLDTTGSEGIAFYYVPPGIYKANCFTGDKQSTISFKVDENTASMQLVLYAAPVTEPPPLPPPRDFTVAYDENSGVVDLNWSRVRDIRLLKYGINRLDVDAGGGPVEFTMTDTSYKDVPFARADSVQRKSLRYTVYSLKRDPGGYNGSNGSLPVVLEAPRPWAYGPRIDSLAPLDSLGPYHVGDTIRIVAAWTNRMRENDSLFWRVQGPMNDSQARAHPAATGKDTLTIAPSEAGSYQFSLTIRDVEGYRSWLSVSVRFLAGSSGP
jgi:hypothetical protein